LTSAGHLTWVEVQLARTLVGELLRSLGVREVAARIPVLARERWNHTDLLVRAGEQYLVTATNEHCMDRQISSTAAGQPGVAIQRLAKPIIRCRAGQWFQLIAAVGRSHRHLFPIGMVGRIRLDWGQEGELLFFANDVIFAYCNNSGQIAVDVRREF
jgi:hypothetical protein